MRAHEPSDTARTRSTDDKGLLAMDESIQEPGMEIWGGKEANVPAAQKSLRHRAHCNRAARRGEYSAAMEGA